MKALQSLAILLVLSSSSLIGSEALPRFISVNGTAELQIPADEIEWNIRIESLNEKLPKAKNSCDASLTQLLNILSKNGIKKDGIEVSPISQGKHFEYLDRERTQDGFFTRLNVYFKLRDLSKYSALVSALSTNPEFETIYARYSDSKYETNNKLAIKKAVLAAKEKADYLAETLGVQLGKVLEVTENDLFKTSFVGANTMASVGPPSAENIQGKIAFKRSVHLKMEIK